MRSSTVKKESNFSRGRMSGMWNVVRCRGMWHVPRGVGFPGVWDVVGCRMSWDVGCRGV